MNGEPVLKCQYNSHHLAEDNQNDTWLRSRTRTPDQCEVEISDSPSPSGTDKQPSTVSESEGELDESRRERSPTRSPTPPPRSCKRKRRCRSPTRSRSRSRSTDCKELWYLRKEIDSVNQSFAKFQCMMEDGVFPGQAISRYDDGPGTSRGKLSFRQGKSCKADNASEVMIYKEVIPQKWQSSSSDDVINTSDELMVNPCDQFMIRGNAKVDEEVKKIRYSSRDFHFADYPQEEGEDRHHGGQCRSKDRDRNRDHRWERSESWYPEEQKATRLGSRSTCWRTNSAGRGSKGKDIWVSR